MSLYDDLIGGNNKLSVHGFCAGLSMWKDGDIIRADLEAPRERPEGEPGILGYGIAPNDEDLDFLKAKYDLSTDPNRFIAKIEQFLIAAEEQKFDMHTKATFQAKVNAIG